MGRKSIIERIIINRKCLLRKTTEAIIRRLPRIIELRSNLYIHLRNLRDNESFWGFFTSPEYMIFIPELSNLKMSSVNVIDCGAGNGLFSLWIEHFRRIRILDWKEVHYTLIEPSLSNIKIIKKNIEENLPQNSYEIRRGAIREKEGNATFYESKKSPWSSSLYLSNVGDNDARPNIVPFVDLSPYLKKENIFLKLDIEGAEFSALEIYKDELSNVKGLIIEWHRDLGYDIKSAKTILENSGLSMAKKSTDNKHFLVELYKRIK